MAQSNPCPSCHTKLTWQDGLYRCEPCKVSYKKRAFCPDCEAELETLQACGATSYFCNQCNGLKSKSQVRIEFGNVG
ncbi:zinc ribbon domain-containing protein [Teredinibacter haidensis]|uniref:zinc ribbon domain-containing protein n=1 Tax=Teredinibacter haidensis TaxID=2731755 RepID=UPI000948C886|nr:zinc ribbon domain-containing protein [Teredinibacter haidensis]